MPISLTLLAAVGILYIVFGMIVGMARGKSQTSIGLGDDPKLLLASRAHGNLTEWAPIPLMLIAGMEYLDAPITMLASLAIGYFIARVLQSVGILMEGEKPHPFRVIGAIGNLVVILWGSVYLGLYAGAF